MTKDPYNTDFFQVEAKSVDKQFYILKIFETCKISAIFTSEVPYILMSRIDTQNDLTPL